MRHVHRKYVPNEYLIQHEIKVFFYHMRNFGVTMRIKKIFILVKLKNLELLRESRGHMRIKKIFILNVVNSKT